MIDRYGTWGQATSLRQMMDRLLQDAVVMPGAAGTNQWTSPSLDAFEEGDNLFIEAHLPGWNPDDINVQVERGF
jgi:HSP20 family molecular chaperone IbpA